MPKVTLVKGRTFHVNGINFTKGVQQSCPYNVAELIAEDDDLKHKFKIEYDKEEVAEDEEGSRPSSKAVRLAAIQNAIADMDDDDENFTSNGKPDARKLTQMLGWQVTAKERDEAMAAEEAAGVEPAIIGPGQSPGTPTPETKGDITMEEIKKGPKKGGVTIKHREEAPQEDVEDVGVDASTEGAKDI